MTRLSVLPADIQLYEYLDFESCWNLYMEYSNSKGHLGLFYKEMCMTNSPVLLHWWLHPSHPEEYFKAIFKHHREAILADLPMHAAHARVNGYTDVLNRMIPYAVTRENIVENMVQLGLFDYDVSRAFVLRLCQITGDGYNYLEVICAAAYAAERSLATFCPWIKRMCQANCSQWHQNAIRRTLKNSLHFCEYINELSNIMFSNNQNFRMEFGDLVEAIVDYATAIDHKLRLPLEPPRYDAQLARL